MSKNEVSEEFDQDSIALDVLGELLEAVPNLDLAVRFLRVSGYEVIRLALKIVVRLIPNWWSLYHNFVGFPAVSSAIIASAPPQGGPGHPVRQPG